MSLKKILSLRHTLAFRLAVYYTAIFTVSSLVAFLVFYLIISSEIEKYRDKDLSGNLREFSSVLKMKGLDELKKTITVESEGDGVANSFFRLITPDGQGIFSTNMAPWNNIRISRSALNHLQNGSNHYFETLYIPGREHNARSVYGVIGPGIIMQIGEYLDDDEEFLVIFRTVFSIVMAFLIPFAACSGWLMGRHALQGVEEVTQTALRISKGDLDQRVSVRTGAEEITRLASTFNSMLDRINALVAGTRNMMDDITHDLKKPIARIRLIAEKDLFTSTPDNNNNAHAVRIMEECDYQMQMINTILDVSEAEAGAVKLHKEQIDIAGVVRNAYELFYPLAEDKNLNFTIAVPETCYLMGDIHKIQRMVANLLDNALKYTPSGGKVTVLMKRDNKIVEITIQDTGIGISEEDLPHIFERFYQCDKSRSQSGVGLGLTLAKVIAISHGGDIEVTSCLGKGSTFTMKLPHAD
jgi:signal transduction histidine kinase